ncbi:hypothetical protein AAV94_07795 [Lampropedia cohaerens]|uniref:Uncharacterized protein n=1 Tax=Lampropedia cohaerens TaxID=1610491 RepID=A0A0U1Q009_9BURK|nr:hypothetical protein AAV94_07795 [Lampropedia cohaerens]
MQFEQQLKARAPGSFQILNLAGQSIESAQAQLQAMLQKACVGTHLYLSGTEHAIWKLYNAAVAVGMHPQEISMFRHEEALTPIYCVHCSTQQLIDRSEEHPSCASCGVVLEVRQHFSRIHGAYLGVVADADQPFGRKQA